MSKHPRDGDPALVAQVRAVAELVELPLFPEPCSA